VTIFVVDVDVDRELNVMHVFFRGNANGEMLNVLEVAVVESVAHVLESVAHVLEFWHVAGLVEDGGHEAVLAPVLAESRGLREPHLSAELAAYEDGSLGWLALGCTQRWLR
jgi:hypothetical protein